MKENFEKNVAYLQKIVPPDDIYLFTEQTFMASLFFLKKWSEHVKLTEEMLRDPVTDKWVRNIIGLLDCRERGVDVNLDLNLESMDE